ncbi:MAG: hypothetical protein ACE15C_13455 [Phycisphaerae bacterium]
METVKTHAVLKRDGRITLVDLPYKKGDEVEVTLVKRNGRKGRKAMTGAELAASRFCGMWADRTDIVDSSAYARRLREAAQNRRDHK